MPAPPPPRGPRCAPCRASSPPASTILQTRITELRAYVEAAIDFPDEEIDFLSDKALRERLAAVFAAFESITAAARQGALLREGLNVVIAGKPNAGKSSLLNRLAGDEVAIVTDVPGTTRDVLRQQVHLDGLPLNLVDTAGLRMRRRCGRSRGRAPRRNEIARADRVLYIVDAGVAGTEDEKNSRAMDCRTGTTARRSSGDPGVQQNRFDRRAGAAR